MNFFVVMLYALFQTNNAFNLGKFLGLVEDCNESWIPANVTDLIIKLNYKVYGQQLAVNEIFSTLQQHYSFYSYRNTPLVLSFNGPTGTGKSFVTELIAQSIFYKGIKSTFYNFFSGNLNFPDVELHKLKVEIANKLKEGIKECDRSMFVFDTVENIPQGVFDTLVTEVENLRAHYSLRNVVFIFISNIGGNEIINETKKQSKDGLKRKDLTIGMFEETLKDVAKSDDGFKDSAIAMFIDYYIPFLPLEKQHVEACIKDELKRLGKGSDKNLILAILEDVHFLNGFSTSGCKNLKHLIHTKNEL